MRTFADRDQEFYRLSGRGSRENSSRMLCGRGQWTVDDRTLPSSIVGGCWPRLGSMRNMIHSFMLRRTHSERLKIISRFALGESVTRNRLGRVTDSPRAELVFWDSYLVETAGILYRGNIDDNLDHLIPIVNIECIGFRCFCKREMVADNAIEIDQAGRRQLYGAGIGVFHASHHPYG